MLGDALNQAKQMGIVIDYDKFINAGIELESWLAHPYTQKIRDMFNEEKEKLDKKIRRKGCKDYGDYLGSCDGVEYFEFLEKYIKRILNEKNSALEQKNRSK